MSEKRFYVDTIDGGESVLTDNGNELSLNETCNLLNELNDENRKLDSENTNLIINNKELKCTNIELAKKNKQLKQQLQKYKQPNCKKCIEYSKEYDYCRECNECHKRYCKYVKDDSRIYVGNGFVSKY